MDVAEPLPEWVHKINLKKKESNQVYKLFFYLMKELHLSWSDLMEMPVPAIIQLSEELSEYAKEQEKQAKKANRKR